jgi:hypothetical protein
MRNLAADHGCAHRARGCLSNIPIWYSIWAEVHHDNERNLTAK